MQPGQATSLNYNYPLTHAHTHTHAYMYTHIYIYIYICKLIRMRSLTGATQMAHLIAHTTCWTFVDCPRLFTV